MRKRETMIDRSGPGPGALSGGRGFGKRLEGLLCLCLCFCLTLGMLPAPAGAAEPSDPLGNWSDTGNYTTDWYKGHEEESVYTLYTAAQLAGAAYLINFDHVTNFAGKTIRLGADIDLSDHLWYPLAFLSQLPFSGEFDGNKKTITGLYAVAGAGGLFGIIGESGKVHDLQISNAYTRVDGSNTSTGIIAETSSGEIYNCAVSGDLKAHCPMGCNGPVYVAGLVGKNEGTIKNCSAQISSLLSKNDNSLGYYPADDSAGGIFAWGSGSAENCFVVVENFDNSQASQEYSYTIGPKHSYCYWDDAKKVPEVSTSIHTQSYPLSPQQIAGTGDTLIGASGDQYANTPSAVTALNNWVGDSGKYSSWVLQNDSPILSIFLPPTYIDITVVPEQEKVSAYDTSAEMSLTGQFQENVELISVTLPATVPIVVDVDKNGAMKRVLSATATMSSRSDTGVTVTLTSVTDNPDATLLDKANFVLTPDPLPSGGSIPLAAGTGKNNVLAVLAAPADGVPATATLKVDGTAKTGVSSLGSNGDSFTIGLTLKVDKTV